MCTDCVNVNSSFVTNIESSTVPSIWLGLVPIIPVVLLNQGGPNASEKSWFTNTGWAAGNV